MSAKLRAATTVALVMLALPGAAQAQAGNPWKIGLTEAPEPDSMAWEDPARISLTIDPDGPDEFSAQVNLEAKRPLNADPFARAQSIGGYLRWNRETGEDRQNNFEAGIVFIRDLDIARLLDLSDEQLRLSPQQLTDLARRRERMWDFSLRVSSAYSRTAQYADATTPTCVATPALPQCNTQFRESLRSSAILAPFNAHLEAYGPGRLFAYAVQPKFAIDHDLLLNSPIDVDTGLVARGSYLSVLGGIAATITPEFINPGWELRGSVQLRQRVHASNSRRASIERSAEQFELSAIYYLLRPRRLDRPDWRVGLGVTYSHGGDPLTGAPDVDRIVLALRIGQY